MTATNGNDFEKYVDGWAEMMITIWKEKMTAYEIGDTGALENSLRTEVYRQSGGNTTKIDHFFLYYGNYVARGVGREFSKGNKGDLGFTPKRKPKPWLSGKYWYSKQKLMAEMLRQTGDVYLKSMSSILCD